VITDALLRGEPFEVDGRPAPAPRAPPRDALLRVYEELLTIERARLQVAVRIERERGIVFPETSVIDRDVRALAEKVYGPAPSTARKASGAPVESTGPAVAGLALDDGGDELGALLDELGADDAAESGEP